MKKPTTPNRLQHNQWRMMLRALLLIVSSLFIGWLVIAPDEDLTLQDPALLPPSTTVEGPLPTSQNQLTQLLLETNAFNAWTLEQQRRYVVLRYELGDSQPWLALLNSGASLTAEDEVILRLLADRQLTQGNTQQAIELLELLLGISPDDGLRYDLGLLWLPVDADVAQAYLQTIDPTSDYGEAATQILEAMQADDWLNLGLVLSDLAAWPAAEYVMTQAIADDPLRWEAYLYRGYIRDQQNGDGLADLETALGLSDTPSLPLYFIGLHWRDIDDAPEAAVAVFELATEFDPTNPAITIELALTYDQLGRRDLAGEWLEITIRLDPDNVEWHRLRARFYAEAPDDDNVLLQPIEQSLVVFPDDADLLTSLGYANYRLGEYTASRTQLIRAVELTPDAPRTQYYYAVTMERFGDMSAAIDGYWTAYNSRLTNPNPYAILAERALMRLRVLS